MTTVRDNLPAKTRLYDSTELVVISVSATMPLVLACAKKKCTRRVSRNPLAGSLVVRLSFKTEGGGVFHLNVKRDTPVSEKKRLGGSD